MANIISGMKTTANAVQTTETTKAPIAEQTDKPVEQTTKAVEQTDKAVEQTPAKAVEPTITKAPEPAKAVEQLKVQNNKEMFYFISVKPALSFRTTTADGTKIRIRFEGHGYKTGDSKVAAAVAAFSGSRNLLRRVSRKEYEDLFRSKEIDIEDAGT